MERWQQDHATRPLHAWHAVEAADEGRLNGQETGDLADVARETGGEDVAEVPTVSPPAVASARTAPRAAPATRPFQIPGGADGGDEDEELERIREILVGPHLREHDRRLREIERRHGEFLAGVAQSPESVAQRDEQERALEETRTELQIVRAELTRERQTRDEQARLYAAAIAELTSRLDRERAERMDLADEPHGQQAMDDLRTQHDVLRAEMARERMAREEQMQAHARALGELNNRLGEQRDEHARIAGELGAQMRQLAQQHDDHARQSAARDAELAARLERERQAHGEQMRQMETAQLLRNESVRRMHEDAQQTLLAMQAERQALAAQLAELRLYVTRASSGEGIHREPGI